MFPAKDVPGLEIVSDYPEKVIETANSWIEMEDGVKLAARIWRPENSDGNPVPAIFEFIPYRKRDARVVDDERMHPYFAGHGYACVRVDIRGSGDSEGILVDEYLPSEQRDACAILRWIAAQDWCDGNIGMMGISWGGFNSLQVASLRPPELKAVIAVGATVDRYNHDVHYKNGCMLNENFGWGTTNFTFSSRPPDPEIVGDRWFEVWMNRLENLHPYAEPWFRHCVRDGYWKHGSVGENYDAIQIPVMSVSGWADAYVDAVPRLFENLKGPCLAINGPWAHQFPHLVTPGPAVDFLGEAVAWWDRWLKGKGGNFESSYRAYCQSGSRPDPDAAEVPGRWIERRERQSPAEMTPLYLSAAGLSEDRGDGCFEVCSPMDLGVACGELIPHCHGTEIPPDQAGDDERSLCFDTAALDGDLDIWGDPELILAVRCDSPTGQIVARLCDVGPEGASQRVSFGMLNLLQRNGDGRCEPVPVGETITVRVPLQHVAHRFPKGHRLRLAISTAYWPMVNPAPDRAGLVIDGAESRLVLPVITDGDVVEIEMAPAKAPPVPELVEIRPARSIREVRHEADSGHTRMEIHDDYGCSEIAAHGMRVDGIKREIYRIHPDDPLSYEASIDWTHILSRGDWLCRTECQAKLACDRDNYYLDTRVQAYHGEEKVFERDWGICIPRTPD